MSATIEVERLDPGERHFRIAGPRPGLRLFLRLLAPEGVEFRTARPVLYIHGATFPSALSVAHRFDGRSWRDSLVAAGFAVWALDFLGYGGSDRYPEMAAPADRHAPLGRVDEAAAQIEATARFILDQHGGGRLALIAHSWGTIATGRFATLSPELVARLVLFGPILERARRGPGEQSAAPPSASGAWRLVTVEQQWLRFIEDVPASSPPVLLRRHFDAWAQHYLAADPDGDGRDPPAVKLPAGPGADIADAWSGRLAYDPARLAAPLLVVRGEWDSLSTDADVRRFFARLPPALPCRDVKIARGTHLMHLEESRTLLYRETEAFLLERAVPHASTAAELAGGTP